jgi:heavy metal sensor kinase
MLESIRARLLLWHTLILVILIGVYAGVVMYAYWRSLLTATDATLGSTAAVIADSLSPDISGTFDLNFPPRFRDTSFGREAGGTYYIVWNARLEMVDRSDPTMAPPTSPAPGAATRGPAREVVISGPAGAQILVGRPLTTVNAAVQSLGLTIAGAGGLVLLLSFAGASFLAGRALAPIARISATAGAMVRGDLTARIPVAGTDSELEQVARALNEAFDRLQTAYTLQRQFTADASHEFRTPLAILRTEFEWALSRPRAAAEYHATITKAHHAVQRLTDIADRLLTLARTDAITPSAQSAIELGSTVNAVVTLVQPLAREHDVTVRVEAQPSGVRANASLLSDAVMNLVTNAIRYNRPGGEVAITIGRDGPDAVLTIRDTGIGIPDTELPRIFDRFYRVEHSRGRDAGGAGLGLAIVREIVEGHGGTISCTSVVDVGSEFVVRLPAAEAAES